jgi:hypothetical protein
MKIDRNFVNVLFVVLLTLVFSLTGCKKNATEPVVEATTTEDAAESVANALGEDNGGVADQVGDIADLSGALGIRPEAAVIEEKYGMSVAAGDTVSKTYDTATQTWTLFVSRSRTNFLGLYRSGFTRTYKYQFVNKNSQSQQNYITGTDTAYTINFKVISGAGYAVTRRMSHNLLSLVSDWVVTGANTSTITINGTSKRVGADTLTTHNFVRSLNHSLDLTFTNVTGPRSPRPNFSAGMMRSPRITGGTINGTYAATVGVLRGESYSEKSFTKTFSVTFDGSAGSINLGGRLFRCDLLYGELTGM